MRSTAIRLSITFPQGYPISWPSLCSVCGREGVAGTAPTVKHAPPVPYCSSCLQVRQRWTRWIQTCLMVALLVNLGPLLYIGAAFDRPAPSAGLYNNFNQLYLMVAFFTIIFSAIAASIGYIRRSELQGVHTQEFRISDLDDPRTPLSGEQSLVEVHFRNHSFYSATLEANKAS